MTIHGIIPAPTRGPSPMATMLRPLRLYDMLHWLMYLRRSSVRARRGTLRALLNKVEKLKKWSVLGTALGVLFHPRGRSAREQKNALKYWQGQ